MNEVISTLLRSIDQAFDHNSWHGTNLKGSIRGIDHTTAIWRPSASRHNIWETVVHAAYWKYIVRRRLLSEARGSFPLEGSNWFRRPLGLESTDKEWKADRQLLVSTHKSLREAVATFNPGEIHQTPPASKVSNIDLILGVAAHDLYHAGQIQLLKRLQKA
ncbi:MAG: hypothetical protein QOJ64_2482 [Acidobacteriota bacterium]|jgi:hypothetical protein|nr:hypothetical protein [Acidobacteriota bacterium]